MFSSKSWAVLFFLHIFKKNLQNLNFVYLDPVFVDGDDFLDSGRVAEKKTFILGK